MNPSLTTTKRPGNSLRLRLRELTKISSETDLPPPPRPPPPMWAPPFDRDRVFNPSGFAYEHLVPDLKVFDGVFPQSEQHKIRLVSVVEHCIARRFPLTLRGEKYMLPCEGDHMLTVFEGSGMFGHATTPSNSGYAYFTTAPYPEWLRDPELRSSALNEIILKAVNLA